MDEQRYKLKKEISTRIKVLHFIFIGVVAYFLIHTIIFIYPDREMAIKFDSIRNKDLLVKDTLLAHRGTIYSRNKEVLATSVTRTSLSIDFACEKFRKMRAEKFKEEAKVLAQTLADCLGDKTPSEYYKIIIDNNHRVLNYNKPTIKKRDKGYWFFKKIKYDTTHYAARNKGQRSFRICRDLDANEWEVIRNVPLLKGYTNSTIEYDHRVYPQGDLAMRTIGRLEEHRKYGIEFAFRDTLAASDGRQMSQKISDQFKIRIEHEKNIEAIDGYDIVTTLDVNVQDVAHGALSQQLMKENAIWGTTIVMECATGDILAMVNLRNLGTRCVEEQNYAIGVPVNPGSTFKLVSAMALLENGVPASQRYHTGLGAEVAMGNNTDATIVDDHDIGKESNGWVDMRTAFAQSSNVYFTKAVLERFKSNPVEFSNFCDKLHLGEPVGLENFGATYKAIKPLNRKHTSRYNALVNMAYGYGVEVTPMHTLTIYNAIANNGRMVAPRLILRTERNGEVVSEAPITVLEEQICSQATLKSLRSFLEEVSKTGTSRGYFGTANCPFTSGSKTGTAQVESTINSIKYIRNDGYYYGSMVTYFPADNPRYTIMTAIFTKSQPGKQKYGAGLAGPVQKHVATYLYNRDHRYAQALPTKKQAVADIKGGNIEKIRTVAAKHGIALTSESEQGWGSSSIRNGNSVYVSSLDIDERVVPNVVGMGLNDAIYLLEKCGLDIYIVGRGKVVSQSIAPATIIDERRKRITITLR